MRLMAHQPLTSLCVRPFDSSSAGHLPEMGLGPLNRIVVPDTNSREKTLITELFDLLIR